MTKREIQNEVRRIMNAARKHQHISPIRALFQVKFAATKCYVEMMNKKLGSKK